ncbi:PUA-like domain-containing protein [Pyronema omphalodes]|nr:PUA-like domain-containing protein [Pyronema omphalodes]
MPGLRRLKDECLDLIKCTKCSKKLRQPLALPCGNDVCRDCIPQTYIRQGISYPNNPERRIGFECPESNCYFKEHSTADCGLDITLGKAVNTISDIIESIPTEASNPDKESEEYKAFTDCISATLFPELECNICYQLLHEPITISCGHTYCLSCIYHVNEGTHLKSLCPICRKEFYLSEQPLTNTRLIRIMSRLIPSQLAARADIAKTEAEELSRKTSIETPIFVCTASFPDMPTPLFIFEPRYQLMISRAWNSNRIFGMVLPNLGVDEGLGSDARFSRHGTMLYIETMHVEADGTSHLLCRGTSRFIINDWAWKDGYIVASTKRISDIPPWMEENIEMRRVAAGAPSTRALMEEAFEFAQQWAVGLRPGARAAYGEPPRNERTLAYWLAAILPVANQYQYKMIKAQSVRERLEIAVGWTRSMERNW